MRQIVDATGLDGWFISTRRDAQEMLPHLVRQLVMETLPLSALARIRFPAGDQVGLPGYDGVVETTVEHPFVPHGISVWEMGTGPAEEKLADDYRKRTGKPGRVDPLQSAFVFVSPHVVRDKDTLEAQLQAEEKWRTVRILDAVDLAAWLDLAPVAARWLAREMGIPVEGMLRLDEYMRQEMDARHGRPIPPALLVGGRTAAQETIVRWIESDSREVRVEGESLEEGAAFIAAVAGTLPDENRAQVTDRLLFVSDSRALDYLSHLQTAHFLVPLTAEVRRRAEGLGASSIRMLVPRMRMVPAGEESRERQTVKLGTIQRTACADALRAMGCTNQAADRISRESKGSLTAVLWMIAQEHDAPFPWTSAEAALDLMPLLLAGQWDADNPQDRAVLAAMAGKDHKDVEAVLARWATPQGPLILRGSVWDWLAWDFAWGCLCPFISRAQVDAFRAAVERVLGEPDPALELASAERWVAAMHGKKHPYSPALRSGLVASIAHFETNASMIRCGDGKVIAGGLVRRLLDGESFERKPTWLSLASWLPDLAEAAPDEYLRAHDLLLKDGTCVAAFFEEGGFFGSSPHTHLLWALERLAWVDAFLSRATLALGALAAVDPGGQLSNRPLNSLKDIFLPWHPHTMASVLHRVAAIDSLRVHHPEVAWQLAAGLLPRGSSCTSGTAKPRWHEWSRDGEPAVTWPEYWQFVQEMVLRMLQWAGAIGGHWKTIIESYNDLRMGNPALASKVLAAIQQLDPATFDKDAICLISDTVRSLLGTHRNLSDAKWTMTEEQLVPFETIYARFQPPDLVSQFKWLFTSWPRPPRMRDVPYEEETRLIEEERLKAAGEIIQQGGIEATLTMFDAFERPDTLGVALAELGLDEKSEVRLLRETLHYVPLPDRFPAALRAGFGYVGRKYAKGGDAWLGAVVGCAAMAWNANAFANLALGLPEAGPTWDKLADWDAEAERIYWQRTVPCVLREAKRDAGRAVSCLLDAGRPYRAIEVAGMTVGRSGRRQDTPEELAVPLELIVKALQEAPKFDPEKEWIAPHMTMVVHYVETLLGVLDAHGIDNGVIAAIEWAWLAALEHGNRGVPALERALSTDPHLFIDILKLVFRAEDEGPRDLSDSDRNRATQGYRLLKAWHHVPGMTLTDEAKKEHDGDIVFHKGAVDEGVLTGWIDAVRDLAAQCGRTAICDSQIGEVLAFAPIDDDGAWPCLPIRNLLERVQSEEMEHGLQTGVANRRGVHSVVSGGVQELALAAKFDGYSQTIHARWPRTAAVMACIAEQFKREAKWHQDREAFEEFE